MSWVQSPTIINISLYNIHNFITLVWNFSTLFHYKRNLKTKRKGPVLCLSLERLRAELQVARRTFSGPLRKAGGSQKDPGTWVTRAGWDFGRALRGQLCCPRAVPSPDLAPCTAGWWGLHGGVPRPRLWASPVLSWVLNTLWASCRGLSPEKKPISQGNEHSTLWNFGYEMNSQ